MVAALQALAIFARRVQFRNSTLFWKPFGDMAVRLPDRPTYSREPG